MKKGFVLQSIICLLTVSCSVHEIETINPIPSEDDVFYATIESYSEADTKVYLDKYIKILWNADDRITIFNKNTFNQQYRFTGDTGANSGFFSIIPSDVFATGNDMRFICAVYPYLEATSISNSGVLTLTLPAEQAYREGSFGLGANTMVSSTNDNLLRFKNVGGYLALKFYGDDVSVSSIKLEGNHDEPLSGDATLTPSVGVDPLIAMASTAGTAVTLTCDTPVRLGATKDEATIFWMVIPPTDFTEGFTLTVTDDNGCVFVKETKKSLSVLRNGVLRISPIEVVVEKKQPNNQIWYTSVDGEIVTLFNDAQTFGNGARIISNEYVDGMGIITCDKDLTYLGEASFLGCSRLVSVSLPNSVNLIGADSFGGCTSLTSISIPDGVVDMGIRTFQGCTSLTDIILPASLGVIGQNTFQDCTNLHSISIPEGVTGIYPEAFRGCSSLESVSLPTSLTTIKDLAFYGCSNLSSVTIPEGVEIIDVNTFTNCTNLTNASLPESLTKISNYAFQGCSGLINVSIPKNVTELGSYVFQGCTSLTSITIPEGVTSIGDYAFQGCTSLTSAYLPDSITIIPGRIFNGCTNLSSIRMPIYLTHIFEYAFAGCSSLTSISIPEGLKYIAEGVFRACSGLTDVTIPKTVTSIRNRSFQDCSSLPNITIPERVTSIGSYAFSGCSSLIGVTVLATAPPNGSPDMLTTNNSNTMIYVPAQSLNDYLNANYWNELGDRIRPIPE